MFWAPLSEVFGRRNLFIISYILFTCFNAGLVGSQNIETVISEPHPRPPSIDPSC